MRKFMYLFILIIFFSWFWFSNWNKFHDYEFEKLIYDQQNYEFENLISKLDKLLEKNSNNFIDQQNFKFKEANKIYTKENIFYSKVNKKISQKLSKLNKKNLVNKDKISSLKVYSWLKQDNWIKHEYNTDNWLNDITNEMLEQINIEREKAWINKVVLSNKLNNISQEFAKYMYENKDFNHVSKNGIDPWIRLKNWWYNYKSMWENIAMWQKTVAQVMKDWMNSAWHKENILDSDFNEVWIWYYKWYWVQEFWTQIQ